jgi:hypothetical protein
MRKTKGINVAGDALGNETSGGVNLNDLWAEIGKVLTLYDTHRSTIVRLLSYPTIAVADVMPQRPSAKTGRTTTGTGGPTTHRSSPGAESCGDWQGERVAEQERRVPRHAPVCGTHRQRGPQRAGTRNKMEVG